MVAITQQIGLQMNDTKTKYMLNRQIGNKVKENELMVKKCEKVEAFKYLGAMITSDQIQSPRYCERDKDSKIGMAWTCG
jgi:hypothetical protein